MFSVLVFLCLFQYFFYQTEMLVSPLCRIENWRVTKLKCSMSLESNTKFTYQVDWLVRIWFTAIHNIVVVIVVAVFFQRSITEMQNSFWCFHSNWCSRCSDRFLFILDIIIFFHLIHFRCDIEKLQKIRNKVGTNFCLLFSTRKCLWNSVSFHSIFRWLWSSLWFDVFIVIWRLTFDVFALEYFCYLALDTAINYNEILKLKMSLTRSKRTQKYEFWTQFIYFARKIWRRTLNSYKRNWCDFKLPWIYKLSLVL